AELLRFVGELRLAEVPVSVAETLDAMRAVAAAGLADRARVREALAAALVKDEANRASFDEVFARFFGAGARAARFAGRPGAHRRIAAAGTGRGEQGASAQARAERARADAPPHGGAPPSATPPQEKPEPEAAGATAPAASGDAAPRLSAAESAAAEGGVLKDAALRGSAPGANAGVEADEPGLDARRQATLRSARLAPFAAYTGLEYEAAREALAPLARRFRLRLGRRLHAAPRGRVDFRRTIRASLQHGGALAELRFRARRPRHVDLLILADVS